MKNILQHISVAIALIFILGCQTGAQIKALKDSTTETAQGPKLTKPVIKKIWVPEIIEDDGRVLIEGHYKWILDKESSWSH